MKTTHFLMAVMALATIAVMTGCGSKKQSLQSTTGQKAIEQDICEKMQEEKPSIRAVGIGEHFREMTARNKAEEQARGQFARMLGAKIISATREEAGGYDVFSSDERSGASVSDQTAKANDFVESITEEFAGSMVLIKTSKYVLPNKQFKVYVCLEFQKGVAELATNIARQVEQRISDEQKLKINFDFEQYRKHIEEELEKIR